jgi:transcriptional regulator with XRE-family HTH domain
MGIKKDLGTKIKRMRMKRGLTQETLSELVDISQRTLSGIEIGENFCTAETLDNIINALDTTPEELFALDHIKEEKDLISEICESITTLDREKLEIAHKVIKGLIKE